MLVVEGDLVLGDFADDSLDLRLGERHGLRPKEGPKHWRGGCHFPG